MCDVVCRDLVGVSLGVEIDGAKLMTRPELASDKASRILSDVTVEVTVVVVVVVGRNIRSRVPY